MPIPALNVHGLLPKGIHDCSMEEIRALFSSTDRRHKRAKLFKNLETFIGWIRPVKCFKFIYIDGSFVTDKDVPGDIDIFLELPPPSRKILKLLEEMKIDDQSYAREKFALHAFLFVQNSPGLDLRAFFQYVRREDAEKRGLQPSETKGILRIAL